MILQHRKPFCLLLVAFLLLGCQSELPTIPPTPTNKIDASSTFSPVATTFVNSTLTPVASPTSPSPVTDQSILQEIIRYKEQMSLYLMQPGWTYLRFDQYDLLPLNSPNPLPAQYQKEFWSHFDKNLKVYEQIDFIYSAETGKVALGIFANGQMRSLWNGEPSARKDPYTPSYDLYLVSTIQGLLENEIPHQLSMGQIVIDGTAMTKIELRFQFTDTDKQWFNLDFDQPVWGVYEVFHFDSETGLLRRYEHSYILDDMTIIPSSITDNFQYIPNSEPPSYVLDLLAQELNRDP